MADRTLNPLVTLRLSRNLLLREVAAEVGCSLAHLSKVERGEHRASPELALKLERLYGGAITRDQILFPAEYPVESDHSARIAKVA